MRKFVVHDALKEEFATVEAIWYSNARTRRVDALSLSWIKYEKQLRRLFSFLVFQHPRITEAQLDAVISVFAENHSLYPETFIAGIERLAGIPIADLLGGSYERLWREIVRIRRYRNKIMHGQNTGNNIKSAELERDVVLLMEWISSLAQASTTAFGYDGLRRNAFSIAKTSTKQIVRDYPFSTPAELSTWLGRLVQR